MSASVPLAVALGAAVVEYYLRSVGFPHNLGLRPARRRPRSKRPVVKGLLLLVLGAGSLGQIAWAASIRRAGNPPDIA